jgi:predicted nucleotide-binding protein
MGSEPEKELLEARKILLEFAERYYADPASSSANEIFEQAMELGKSASGSWLGYQANVYYKNFSAPPAGKHFDIQHGTGGSYFSEPASDWIEHTEEEVSNLLIDPAGKAALAVAHKLSEHGRSLLSRTKMDVSSVLSVYIENHDDPFVRRMAEEIEKIEVLDAAIANEMAPRRNLITSDMRAIQQGTRTPPHIRVLARISASQQPALHCRDLADRLERLAIHIARTKRNRSREARLGTNVFIGHGRSAIWRDLKDFIRDRLGLPYDEFNRVPVAGITNIARLSEMLDDAICAFIIMTAEDEKIDGKLHARMNVIHEAGLFQGRLGFTKAIVLLEDGCEEFSNIQGLGQIRFPQGKISAAFEEIRQVLEREGVLNP